MEKLLRSAAERAHSYLQDLNRRGVAPCPEAVQRLDALNMPLPDTPAAAETVLDLLDKFGSPATMGTAGGRFFGFVVGGSLPAALAANWLAAAWDQNAFSSTSAPGAVAIENVAQRWLREIFRLPVDSAGALTSGATMANFASLAAARHHVLAQAGWNVEKEGLFGAPPITVVVGAEVHPSLLKGLGLLGLGRDRVVAVPADGQGRMRADSMPDISGPAIVCIQAGNVNSGAFDPAAEICARAHEQGAWVHVDGAFGLWAAAARARAQLMAGYDAADSWATDAHKWLNVPYDCGIAFVRNAEALRAAMSMSAAYLPHGGDGEPMDSTPESSRRARGVEVWAALYSLGRSGLSDLIERTCRHAARFASSLRDAGFEILNEVVLNQVLVSFGDDEKTRRVIAGVQADGTCWCGGTVWHGKAAMRISVSSWATTDEDVERSLEAIKRIAKQEK